MQKKQEKLKPGNTLTKCMFGEGQKKEARRKKVVEVQAVTERTFQKGLIAAVQHNTFF